jgi:NTP pyrophosphatase (non-canonical NTP hydrolase)
LRPVNGLKEDTMLTFTELRNANVARCNESYRALDSWSPSDWLAGLVEEVGEISRIIYRQKTGRYTEEEAQRRVEEEFADALTYLDLLAARMGVDLGDAVLTKFNLVSHKIGSEVHL